MGYGGNETQDSNFPLHCRMDFRRIFRLSLWLLWWSNQASGDTESGRRRLFTAEDGSSSHSIRCYSCMSATYESYFTLGLDRVFVRPSNFTDHCKAPHRSRSRLPTVECNSICISMREETEILGMPFTGHIRGCYDRMLINGFNQTIVRWYKWIQRDSCNFYNKQEVLQLGGQAPQNGRTLSTGTDKDQAAPTSQASTKNHFNQIYICTCFSDGCNGSPGLNRSGFGSEPVYRHLVLISAWLISRIWAKFYDAMEFS